MAKKKLTIEDVLVPKDEIPYEVPENWCWVKLGAVAEIVTGNTPAKKNPEYYGEYLPFVKPADLDQGRKLLYSTELLSELGSEKARIIPKHSTAVCCIGSIGKSAYLEVDAATNQQINCVIPKGINSLYLYYYILSEEFQRQLWENSSATTISIINKSKMSNLNVAVPPLAEQVRIVNRIESLFDKVDKSSELVDEARDGFEKRRAAILERAFSGELTKKWRDENGVSNEWKTEKLSERVTLISGQHIMNKDYNDERIGIPYLTGPSDFEELYPVVSKWTEKPKALATTDDILITVKGSGVGKVNICNIEQVAISRQLMAIRCVDIENVYLFWYLKNRFNLLQQLSTGTAIPGVSRGDILDMEISVCSKEEQKEVVRILENMLNKESEVEMLTKIDDNIDIIKKSILAKAFRGELGSNDLDDESSVELLKNLI